MNQAGRPFSTVFGYGSPSAPKALSFVLSRQTFGPLIEKEVEIFGENSSGDGEQEKEKRAEIETLSEKLTRFYEDHDQESLNIFKRQAEEWARTGKEERLNRLLQKIYKTDLTSLGDPKQFKPFKVKMWEKEHWYDENTFLNRVNDAYFSQSAENSIVLEEVLVSLDLFTDPKHYKDALADPEHGNSDSGG